MNKEKRRVPKLRFPGFTEDWEQRKLGDTNTFFTDGNYGNDYPTANEMSDSINGVPFLRGSNLDNGAINLMDVHYITKQKHNLLTSGHTKFDDIIIAVRGSLGNCGYVAKQFIDININSQLAIIRTDKNELSGLFLIEYLLSYLGKKEINRNITGTALKQLPINSLKMINIKYPSINEQEKISILLSKLNTSITLHQRKLEHLNLKKKALLQKLFPKNGERYSELRFPGFTDAWEQRKLNEFLSVSNFKNIDNKYNKNDVLSVSGDYGIVNQIEFQGRSFAGVSVSNYGVVETGDIVYTKSPLKLNPYGIIKANRINAGIVSTLYAIYKTKKNCDSKFIEHYFNLDSRLNKYLKPLVNKGAKNDMKVSSENALIGEVCFPHVTEQKLIADFLDRLDLFITLHQRKLEHLQLQKKALLQQMFV